MIRIAEAADVEAILAFDPLAQHGDTERIAAIGSRVAQGNTLVIQDGPSVLGYLVALPRHFFGRDFIELLIVHPGHRRRGLGSSLVAAALAAATTDRVFTSTNQSNGPMKELLSSGGWTLSGTLDGLDPGDPEEVYWIDRAQGTTPSG